MEKLPPLGTAIGDVVIPTIKIFAPLLHANAAAITSTPKKEFTYGHHPRHKLDVYLPPNPHNSPILFFLYGGGLTRGDKTLPNVPLCHANIGHFFAQNYGYAVVVPDYRLVGEAHDAKFPSGGEDLALAIEWVRANLVDEAEEGLSRDLLLMGNSAGGVHVSTFVFGQAFAEQRKKLLKSGNGSLRLRAVVQLSVPFDFGEANSDRLETLTRYYGDTDGVSSHCAVGLLKAAREQQGGIDILPEVKVFVLNGTLDPENEILLPKKHFLEQWEKIEDVRSREALTAAMMKGQNHISPFLSLGTNLEEEEAWGHQVGAFCEKARKPG